MLRPRNLILLVIAILIAGGVWWLRIGRGPEVTVASPARGTAAEIVYATGAVEPVRWAKVTSLVRQRIVDICECEGKSVKRGDVLARLDDKEIRAQLQELRAREDFAKREMERVSELVSRGVTTPQAHERASTDLRQAQALISVQRERLGEYTITSPIDGVVLRRDGEVGEMVEPGQVLFRVGVLAPLEVEAVVNEEDIPRVKVGQTVLFRTDAFPDRRIEGTVRDITPMGDPVEKTYRIRVDLPADTPLHIGMSVEANVITREKENALLVPASAVQDGHVFVVETGRVHRRAVETGIRGSRAIEITSGLSEGDRVVASPDAELRDGQRVRVKEGPA